MVGRELAAVVAHEFVVVVVVAYGDAAEPRHI